MIAGARLRARKPELKDVLRMTTIQAPSSADVERKLQILAAIRRGKWLWIPDSITDRGLQQFAETLGHLTALESEGLIRITSEGLGKHEGRQVLMRVEVQPVAVASGV